MSLIRFRRSLPDEWIVIAYTVSRPLRLPDGFF
jgi:hypothetical protein